MNDQLINALLEYTKYVRNSFRGIIQSNDRDQLRLIFDKDKKRLQNAVAELENSSQFNQLVEKTKQTFSEAHPRAGTPWRSFIECFFRRSRYYLNIFEKCDIDDSQIFNEYCKAFREKRITRYLAPMTHVSFSKQIMNFGNFQIRQFSNDELAQQFQSWPDHQAPA